MDSPSPSPPVKLPNTLLPYLHRVPPNPLSFDPIPKSSSRTATMNFFKSVFFGDPLPSDDLHPKAQNDGVDQNLGGGFAHRQGSS
ncbi:hypothetical protein ACFX13_013219 [Malus domestica]